MLKKNKEKVIYLITDTDKKAPLINLYSLPTKCPICHLLQEPKPISFKYNQNDDAIVKFCCIDKNCKSSFSALYLGSGKWHKEYYFLFFI